MNNDALITVLRATINDLVMLGSMTNYEYDDSEARAIAEVSDALTHSAKFFIANRRINQLSRVIKNLETTPQRINNHDF